MRVQASITSLEFRENISHDTRTEKLRIPSGELHYSGERQRTAQSNKGISLENAGGHEGYCVS